MKHLKLHRRAVLRGLGAAVALPLLEAMGPRSAFAAPVTSAPNRLAVLYVPNGCNMADWTPTVEGTEFELPHTLQPLANMRQQVNVLTGLTADKARANGDGGGDHARALSAFLTGAQPRKTDGTDIRAGVSVDQVAASRIGHLTRLPSLEIGCESGAMAGNCDSGYSCVYSSTMSWKSATQPLPKEVNPKLVFERLFGSEKDARRAQREAARKSILDFVRDDSKDLANRLGQSDQRKLDEYFTAIRDIEVRMERAASLPPIGEVAFTKPAGAPNDYAEHIRLMGDLMVLAFQTDVTRICTFVLANEGSNRSYPFISIPEGHHELSHHGNDAAKKQKLRDINTFHMTQFAYLLEKLNATVEGEGSLLNNCMIAYGSGNSDGNAHNHDDLPVLLAGGGAGSIQPGRHIRYEKETPLNNLWLSLLDRLTVDVEELGDSTGRLNHLS